GVTDDEAEEDTSTDEELRDKGPKDGGPKDEGPKEGGPKDEGPKEDGPKDEGLTGAEVTFCNFKWTLIPPRLILGANSFPVIALIIRVDLYSTFPVSIASANSLQPS